MAKSKKSKASKRGKPAAKPGKPGPSRRKSAKSRIATSADLKKAAADLAAGKRVETPAPSKEDYIEQLSPPKEAQPETLFLPYDDTREAKWHINFDGSKILVPKDMITGPGRYIGRGSTFGIGCELGRGCYIGPDSQFGNRCELGNNCYINMRCRISSGIILPSGSALDNYTILTEQPVIVDDGEYRAIVAGYRIYITWRNHGWSYFLWEEKKVKPDLLPVFRSALILVENRAARRDTQE